MTMTYPISFKQMLFGTGRICVPEIQGALDRVRDRW